MQWTRVASGGLPPTCAPLLPRPVSQRIPGPAACRLLHTPAGTQGQVRKRSLTELFTTEFYSRNREQHKRLPSQLSQDKL